MKLYCSLLLAFLIASCERPKPKTLEEPKINPKHLISCEGIGEVKLSLSYQDLEKQFGATALTTHENSVSGKFVTLWEGKPEALNIYGQEGDVPFKKIKYIEVSKWDSPYITKRGLRVGISIRDVVKINGNLPVTFNNFYSTGENGLITNFNNGDIIKENPCIGGHLEVLDKKNINVKELDKFQSQAQVESFDRVLERMDVALASIRVFAK